MKNWCKISIAMCGLSVLNAAVSTPVSETALGVGTAANVAITAAIDLDNIIPFQLYLQHELGAAAPDKLTILHNLKSFQERVRFILSLTREEKNKLAEEIVTSWWNNKPGVPDLFEILADDIEFAVSLKKSMFNSFLPPCIVEVLEKIQSKLEQISIERAQNQVDLQDALEKFTLKTTELNGLREEQLSRQKFYSRDLEDLSPLKAELQAKKQEEARVSLEHNTLNNKVLSLLGKSKELQRDHDMQINLYKSIEAQSKQKSVESLVIQHLLPTWRKHSSAYYLCAGIDKQKILQSIQYFEPLYFKRIIENCGWYDELKPQFESDHPRIVELVETKRRVQSILEAEAFDVTKFLSVIPDIIDGLKAGDDGYISFVQKIHDLFGENAPSISLGLRESPKKNILSADYLSLYFCQRDQALNHIDLMMNEFGCDQMLDKAKVVDGVRQNFSAGILKDLSEQYERRMKSDYTMPSFRVENIKVEEERIETFVSTVDLKGYSATFTGCRVKSVEPEDILVDIYGGDMKGGKIEKNEPMSPLHNSMMVVSPQLGDSDFEVFQADQLTEAHFATTHAVLLKRMSAFVAYLRTQYPQAKIHLYGSSFGGFFAASYAYLQSGGRYNEWAEQGIQTAFGAAPINPIDGIICHAPGLDLMQKIMAQGSDLRGVTIRVCLHLNHDDERVKLEEQMPFVNQFTNPNVVVSPFGAQPFMGELGEIMVENLRGHHNNSHSRREFDEQVLRFLRIELPA